MLLASCSTMDEMVPEGQYVTKDQVQSTNEAVPDRVSADIAGVYAYAGQQYAGLPDDERDDDFGYPTLCLSLDSNGPDMVSANSGYNWFSPASDYSDRNANYANPYIRYAFPYNQIKLANDVINSIDEATATADMIYTLAQARAVRAFDYLALAPYFQFRYQDHQDSPCVPLVTESTADFANNPRATVKQIYDQIIGDLTYAVDNLEGFVRTDKTKIDRQVAYGLRARAYLSMGMYAEAAADAEAAMEGYTPASISEVSTPAFCSLSEHNWMWGILIEAANLPGNGGLPSWPSQLGSLSATSYTAGVGVYRRINPLLYDKISSTDVRKGWWVDENLSSPLLSTVSWEGVSGDAIATLEIPNVKVPFDTYTNVKFGMKSGVGSTVNDCDWCLMRVEEMILTRAEGLAMSGSTSEARTILEDFVKTYRDPSYTCQASDAQGLQDEIWKQRRIELWGEGFSMFDLMRLAKPLVRIHGGDTGIWPDAFAFNMTADDGYRLMRFPQSETNANSGIPTTENVSGTAPVSGQNGNLRDGVTD